MQGVAELVTMVFLSFLSGIHSRAEPLLFISVFAVSALSFSEKISCSLGHCPATRNHKQRSLLTSFSKLSRQHLAFL